MQARSIRVKVLYDNKDISEDIAPFLKSFSYNDNLSGTADDIDLTLEDRRELWEGDWLPEKGAMLTVSLISANWEQTGEEELALGLFEVDEIELSGLPHEVKIKGVSVPENNKLRGEERSRSWEKVKLSAIAKDIADEAELELFIDTDNDKELDRAEQTEESDLSFLMRICKDNGLALKITDGKLVIFDEEKYEQAEPVGVIDKYSSRVTGYSLRSKTREVYAACHVKYDNTQTGELIEYTFRPDEEKKGKTLQVSEQVQSVAEAEEKAKKKLREKNREEVTVGLNLIGSFRYSAGLTYKLSGFHAFDGKYLITKVGHSVGGGYQLSLDMRRCLDGY